MNNKDTILLSLLVGIKENLNLTETEKNVIMIKKYKIKEVK